MGENFVFNSWLLHSLSCLSYILSHFFQMTFRKSINRAEQRVFYLLQWENPPCWPLWGFYRKERSSFIRVWAQVVKADPSAGDLVGTGQYSWCSHWRLVENWDKDFEETLGLKTVVWYMSHFPGELSVVRLMVLLLPAVAQWVNDLPVSAAWPVQSPARCSLWRIRYCCSCS